MINKPDLRILHTLSRSGGTLVSRCLGCMDNVILLSEIHPHGHTWQNPMYQANEWFQLFTDEELETYRNKHIPFIETIQIIHRKCVEQGKTLVIRDWSHLDYFGKPFIPAPTCQPLLANGLRNHFNIIQTALVRHPVDQWVSLHKLNIMEHTLSLEDYLKGCHLFSELALTTGFIKYEDFTQHPDQELSALCFWLKLEFDENYTHKWHGFTHITGDQDHVNDQHTRIIPLKQANHDNELLSLFVNNDHYRQALHNLDYRHPE